MSDTETTETEKRNTLNIGKMIREHSDHRVSQAYVNEIVDIVEGIVYKIVEWSDNAADVTENGTLLLPHVPYWLADRHRAIEREIQKHYDKIDEKENKRREREAKKSSSKFRDMIERDDKMREEAENEE